MRVYFDTLWRVVLTSTSRLYVIHLTLGKKKKLVSSKEMLYSSLEIDTARSSGFRVCLVSTGRLPTQRECLASSCSGETVWP